MFTRALFRVFTLRKDVNNWRKGSSDLCLAVKGPDSEVGEKAWRVLPTGPCICRQLEFSPLPPHPPPPPPFCNMASEI